MFHLLGFLFLIIIIVLIIGLSIIGTVLSSIFRLGGLRKNKQQTTYRNTTYQSSASAGDGVSAEEGGIHPKRKKLFSEDEGEYVDFEEIKEE